MSDEPEADEPTRRPVRGAVLTVAFLALGLLALVRVAPADRPLPAVARRAMTDALPAFGTTEPVSAVVYGFRAFDTFGETFLLLAAVTCVVLLTRHREHRSGVQGEEEAGREEQSGLAPTGVESADERDAREAELREESDGAPGPLNPDAEPVTPSSPERTPEMTVVTRTAVRIVLPLLGVAGLYLVAQGYSPGGGFPAGGVALGVLLLVWTAFGYRRVAPVVGGDRMETVELVGALALVAVLTIGLPLAGAFGAGWVPLAPEQTLRSGGLLQVSSLVEFVEVGSGLVIAVFALMQTRNDWVPEEQA